MIAPQAHAAHWEMSWIPKGTSHAAYYPAAGRAWADNIESWPNYDPITKRVLGEVNMSGSDYDYGRFTENSGAGYGYGSDYGDEGPQQTWKPILASDEGSVIIYLKWVQESEYNEEGERIGDSGPFVPAPKQVLLCVTGTAGARVGGPTDQSAVKVKFHDKEGTETSQATNYNGPAFDRDSRVYVYDGDIRIPLSVPEGSSEVEKTISFVAKATTQEMPSPAQYNQPYGQVFLEIHAKSASLDLSISRGISAKRWDDPNLNKDRDEWVEADGTGHGHSRHSYKERIDTSTSYYPTWEDVPIKLSQTFSASLGSGWSPSSVGTWSNSHPYDRPFSSNSPASHVENLPDSGALLNSAGVDTMALPLAPGWYDTPSSGSDVTVSYDLEDATQTPSIKEKATYILKLHDEWENPTPDRDETWTRCFFDNPERPYSNDSGTGNTEPKKWEMVTKATQSLEASLGLDFKLHDAINIGASAKVGTIVEITKTSGAEVSLAPGERAIPGSGQAR
ncbi:hypothetical protein B1R32_1142 [Abditibacterium utsteinense]|uniref:Uncharacterized protein n=1 Tax=Abditibacterium utsteinense TaxID=1960156 RepID=A0A2S8SQV2_9BACT|nr:hypothetical protein [Abditibacterium utsteinense]PQV63177.1 hypothetical protein B1R32_1142 [Abditibacterium utsteinense]